MVRSFFFSINWKEKWEGIGREEGDFDERDFELFAKVIFKSDVVCCGNATQSEIGKGERLNERYVPSLTSRFACVWPIIVNRPVITIVNRTELINPFIKSNAGKHSCATRIYNTRLTLVTRGYQILTRKHFRYYNFNRVARTVVAGCCYNSYTMVI